MDYGNTERPSIDFIWLGLGGATVLQLAFLGEGDPNFPWEKFPLGQQSVKKELKKTQTVAETNGDIDIDI